MISFIMLLKKILGIKKKRELPTKTVPYEKPVNLKLSHKGSKDVSKEKEKEIY